MKKKTQYQTDIKWIHHNRENETQFPIMNKINVKCFINPQIILDIDFSSQEKILDGKQMPNLTTKYHKN